MEHLSTDKISIRDLMFLFMGVSLGMTLGLLWAFYLVKL